MKLSSKVKKLSLEKLRYVYGLVWVAQELVTAGSRLRFELSGKSNFESLAFAFAAVFK